MRNFKNTALVGKTAIITGGGGLLGPHHAIGLSLAGAKVILVDIDKAGLALSKKTILEANLKAKIDIEILDITDLVAVEEFEKKYRKTKCSSLKMFKRLFLQISKKTKIMVILKFVKV